MSVTAPSSAPSALVSALRNVLPDAQILVDEAERLVYEADGYLVERRIPDLVVFPHSAEQLAAVLKACQEQNVSVIPRGAGTSLAGGCLPVGGGVMVCLSQMRTIHEINLADRYAIVDAGVVNARLNQQLTGTGLHFAPDPSSAGASTIGGNVATNAGGPHTLKYGVTSNHVLGLEVVLADGSILQLGGVNGCGYDWDLAGLFTGSEGTLGFCTKAIVRLELTPESWQTRLVIFDSLDDAVRVVTDIIGAGIVPAALELMDQGMLTAIEDRYHHGLPTDAGAVLIIEVDGPCCATDAEIKAIDAICDAGSCREIRKATTPAERDALWKCRKQAFGAIGKLSTSFCTQDGVVPRTRLPELLRHVLEVAEKYQLKIFNVFHAGDGNIHPILLFDERDREQVQRVLDASGEILSKCLEFGGTVTGEHGIGVEKLEFMTQMFDETDMMVFQNLRRIFDPDLRLARGKLLPQVD
ncbi:FAD-binding oxidoreductase [Rubinisphaera sp. JC750]|uniref:FAD-binding oxidoreductase n=1 Tax=Rubinisphaera sp. JC750 TaxID=2898658 RepID=UPI001F210191|nr:FAD-linked oxidase C-terminal domain-containing protein [Rubinisphaera sp. JC750]